jgi:hypothetical protein
MAMMAMATRFVRAMRLVPSLRWEDEGTRRAGGFGQTRSNK